MKKSKFLSLKLLLLTGCCAAFLAGGCFSSKGYTITFETNGGTEYNVLTTENGSQKIALPTPERVGYIFEGWYENEDLETGLITGDTYLPKKNITLYAKWKAVEFTVHFQSNGGTEYESITAVAQTVALPVPEKAGCIFLGWYENSNFSGEAVSGNFITSNEEITLYARWQVATGFVVSFDSNGGTFEESVEDFGNGVALPIPEKYGYAFTGWYTDASCAGTPYNGEYFATQSLTLYAGWEETVYLYVYYGDTNNYVRLNYEPGTVLNVADLEIPDDITVNGTPCSFDYWADKTFSPVTSLTLNDHTDIFAIFDEKDAPVKDNFIPNSDGSYTSTHRGGVRVFIDEGVQRGGYSIDMTFPKGYTGGINATFRMKLSGQDYPYDEPGTEYLSAGMFPETGVMQIYRVRDGVLSNFMQRIYMTDLPESWNEKFNAALIGELVTVNFTVQDFGDSFEVYLDGEKVYTCTDATTLAEFAGTGFGVRSSTPSVKFSNAQFAEFKTVNLQANGGNNLPSSILYSVGKLQVGVPLKENSVFEGWYYDEALTQKVDLNSPIVTDGMSIYAKYVAAEINLTLYDGENKITAYGYDGKELYLPVLENKANRIFTGWYYDEACTQAVDGANPSITASRSLYAGWRLPKHDSFVLNQDGSYTIAEGSANGAFVVAESSYQYTEYKLNFTMNKGTTSGAATLAIRMKMYQDNIVDGKSLYLTFGLNTAATNGKVQLGYSNGEGRYVSIAAIPLTDTPNWNATWTAATGALAVELSARDYGDSIEFYVNGELAYTLTDATVLSTFDGVGYGIRSSAKDITYKVSHRELATYNLTLVNGNSQESFTYVDGRSTLPTLTSTTTNRAFGGWCYDEDCTQMVNLAEHDFVNRKTLYAYWRYPMHTTNMTINNNNGELSYTCSSTVIAIVGETPYDLSKDEYTEYTTSFDLTKGTTTGNLFLGFRMSGNTDNVTTGEGWYFMAFGIRVRDGAYGFGYVKNGGYTKIALATADSENGWYKAFNATTTGETIKCALTVKDYGDKAECYINGYLVYTYTGELLADATMQGVGYGIFTLSAKNTTYYDFDAVELKKEETV